MRQNSRAGFACGATGGRRLGGSASNRPSSHRARVFEQDGFGTRMNVFVGVLTIGVWWKSKETLTHGCLIEVKASGGRRLLVRRNRACRSKRGISKGQASHGAQNLAQCFSKWSALSFLPPRWRRQLQVCFYTGQAYPKRSDMVA